MKEALLNSKDFLNQHSDSNSTGLIELGITSDYRIRDLKDWKNKTKPQFLIDIYTRNLHYYFIGELVLGLNIFD